jgi:vacuolar-type H+-ATPase subunit I/STV1
MKKLLERFLKKKKIETLENISIAMIFFGIILVSLGLVFNFLKLHQIDAYFAMSGSFLVFIFLFIMIVVLFLKE